MALLMRIVIAIALLALSACGSKGDETPDGNLPDGEVPIEVEFSFTDLDLDGEPSELTALRFIPGGSEFLALARTGQVYHYDLDTEAGETTLLGQFSPPDVHVQLDCGLLDAAFRICHARAPGNDLAIPRYQGGAHLRATDVGGEGQV